MPRYGFCDERLQILREPDAVMLRCQAKGILDSPRPGAGVVAERVVEIEEHEIQLLEAFGHEMNGLGGRADRQGKTGRSINSSGASSSDSAPVAATSASGRSRLDVRSTASALIGISSPVPDISRRIKRVGNRMALRNRSTAST